jgi:NAD(P)-dependent dehydrogenase (short-subunit alcohol dehydrogenase family)
MAKGQKAVVVTGVSTGIGWGAAKVLTKAGYKVFGSVRNETDAKRLQAEFGTSFTPLIFDVTDEKAVRASVANVRAGLDGQKLFGLVNNAGISVAGPLLYMPLDEFKKQIDVNLNGVFIATQAFAPLLGVDGDLQGKPGRIVNISSVGGRVVMPFLAPYSASKFALEGFSEGLRRELLPFGVDVIVIAPGAVATAIWAKGDLIDTSRYADTAYAKPLDALKVEAAAQAKKGLKPEKLGRAILRALTVRKSKTRYVVTPEPFTNWLLNTLPKRQVDRLIAARFGFASKTA